jgi:hypothetical protein
MGSVWACKNGQREEPAVGRGGMRKNKSQVSATATTVSSAGVGDEYGGLRAELGCNRCRGLPPGRAPGSLARVFFFNEVLWKTWKARASGDTMLCCLLCLLALETTPHRCRDRAQGQQEQRERETESLVFFLFPANPSGFRESGQFRHSSPTRKLKL